MREKAAAVHTGPLANVSKQGWRTPKTKSAGNDFNKHFLKYCGQSIAYYIVTDTAFFCSEDRPTKASNSKFEKSS